MTLVKIIFMLTLGIGILLFSEESRGQADCRLQIADCRLQIAEVYPWPSFNSKRMF